MGFEFSSVRWKEGIQRFLSSVCCYYYSFSLSSLLHSPIANKSGLIVVAFYGLSSFFFLLFFLFFFVFLKPFCLVLIVDTLRLCSLTQFPLPDFTLPYYRDACSSHSWEFGVETKRKTPKETKTKENKSREMADLNFSF